MQKLLPPLLTAILLALMAAGTLWVKYPLTEGSFLRVFGAVIGVSGAILSIAAKRHFIRANTNVDTFSAPTTLVTSGWFRFSRNPMYLGLLMILMGAALVLNNAWTVLGPMGFYAAAALWYIPYEEKQALEAFGESYLKYCQSVRRWV